MHYDVSFVLGIVSLAAVLSLGSPASADGHDCEIEKVTGTDTANDGLQCLLLKMEALATENQTLAGKM